MASPSFLLPLSFRDDSSTRNERTFESVDPTMNNRNLWLLWGGGCDDDRDSEVDARNGVAVAQTPHTQPGSPFSSLGMARCRCRLRYPLILRNNSEMKDLLEEEEEGEESDKRWWVRSSKERKLERERARLSPELVKRCTDAEAISQECCARAIRCDAIGSVEGTSGSPRRLVENGS